MRLWGYITITLACGVFVPSGEALDLQAPRHLFSYRDAAGRAQTAGVIDHPLAKIDPRIDPKLRHAASLAQERAHAHSRARCWHYVKEALLAAHVVDRFPKTEYAREAGAELVRDFGFRRLPIRDPYAAPLGSVIVYDRGRSGYGHVEIRTQTGFVSDYFSKTRCRYPLLGIYAKS